MNLSSLLSMANKFVPYAQNFLKYDQPVDIELASDPENAKKTLGRTAYYDPQNYKIAVYADGRHPKDILRSLSHELVHHAQNCRGEFDKPHDASEGYIKKDPHSSKKWKVRLIYWGMVLLLDFLKNTSRRMEW